MIFGSLQLIDAVIILIYVTGCVVIGLYKARNITNIREYTIGSGRFHDVVIVSTIFATLISASATTGTVEKIYAYGLFFAIPRIIAPLCLVIMIKIYGEHIDQFKGCLSISDIMHKLYGAYGRWITNFAAVILTIGTVACQAAAMGHVFNYFLGFSYEKSLYISILIMAIYSSMGGIRAVAFTDVFQLCVFVIAIPIACATAYYDVGGYTGVIKSMPHELITLNLNSSNIWLFLSLIVYSLIPSAEGAYIQRFLMANGRDQLVRSLKIVTLLGVLFMIMMCMVGFLIRAKDPNIDPNLAFIHFISHYVSAGTRGLVVAGLLAIIMSTADSWLNYASVLCAHDIVKKLVPKLSEKHELLLARVSTFIIGGLAATLASSESNIISLIWLADNFWHPLILIPLSAGFLGFRANSVSFVISAISGIFFTVFAWRIVGEFATISLMMGITGSTLGLFITHYLQQHKKKLLTFLGMKIKNYI